MVVAIDVVASVSVTHLSYTVVVIMLLQKFPYLFALSLHFSDKRETVYIAPPHPENLPSVSEQTERYNGRCLLIRHDEN